MSMALSSSHSSSDDPIMEQAKQVFQNLSDQQQREFLSQLHMGPANAFTTTATQQPSLVQQTPRSIQYNFPTANLGSMDRTRSAPAPPTMARSMSTANVASPDSIQRSLSVAANWQTSLEEQPTDYALYSESASFARQSPLQTIPESITNASLVEYSPDEYITSCIPPSSSPQIPLSHPQHPHLQLQLTPNSQWTPSSDGSVSPSTPALMTPATQSSSMSRQSSFNPQLFTEDLSMLRVQSDSSSAMLSLLPEDGSISFSSSAFDVDSKTISSCVDSSFSAFTGFPSENFLSANVVSAASAQALVTSDESYLAEDMRRSASISSESNASSASVPSTCSRQSQRQREINAQASRKLAPKAIDALEETKSMSSNVQMTRIRSEDGSSKTVGVLTKTPYVRPQHPKIMCQYCSERPDGFRGTHELDRHVARAHAAVRKGYICIDASTDKKFLANCKHCRSKKVYGAYYNAAAHLRRAHFHPRKRGRKGKNDEKRGGIGGGDHPPMDYLKQNWIKEVEVENKATAGSPESVSDSAEPSSQDSFDSTYEMDVTYNSSSQLQPQPTNDVPVQIDANQYMDFGMSMSASESLVYGQTFSTYDNMAQPINDISSFQFDAYSNQ